MNVKSFTIVDEIAAFITTNAITAADCKIIHNPCENVWYLFWW
jgi:hypothetical protein